MTTVDEAREALLDHFVKVGRFAPGGRHATEHSRRTDALIAAVWGTAYRELVLAGASSPMTVDEARAALVRRLPGLVPDESYVDAFEAAVRAESRKADYADGFRSGQALGRRERDEDAESKLAALREALEAAIEAWVAEFGPPSYPRTSPAWMVDARAALAATPAEDDERVWDARQGER